jgi:hypothetical protein
MMDIVIGIFGIVGVVVFCIGGIRYQIYRHNKEMGIQS